MPKFSPLDVYEDMYFTDARYIDLWGGRGRGGSYQGTDYFLYLLTQPKYFRGYLVRQAFNDIRESLWRDLMDRIKEHDIDEARFVINKNEMIIIDTVTKNMITSKGVIKDSSRTGKLKSLAGATHVLIEEADELGEDDFDQLDLSVRSMKADNVQVIRIFNPPPKRHWIWRDYTLIDSEVEGYLTAVPKVESGILSIFSTYIDNFDNVQPSTVQKFERFKTLKPDYYYTIIKGLIGEGSKGRIYRGWERCTDKEYFDLDTRQVIIIDFGYSVDPCAVIGMKYAYGKYYCHEFIYKAGLDNLELSKMLVSCGIDKKTLLLCDYGNGGDVRIHELRRGFKGVSGLEQGFNAQPATKPKKAGSISLVQSSQVVVTESSNNIWNEYLEYSWALDRFKEPTDEPVDKNDHAMDAIRYGVVAKGVNRW